LSPGRRLQRNRRAGGAKRNPPRLTRCHPHWFSEAHLPKSVMAGLGPAIHENSRPKSIKVRTPQLVFPGLGPGTHERLLVDGRAKPGQDAAGVVRFNRIMSKAWMAGPSPARRVFGWTHRRRTASANLRSLVAAAGSGSGRARS